MTTIIGLIQDNKGWMACETRATLYPTGAYVDGSESKIHKAAGTLIGVAGFLRDIQMVKYVVDFQSHDSEKAIPYIMNNITEPIRFSLSEMGREGRTQEGISYGESEYLLLNKWGIFLVTGEFAILPVNTNYYAIGSGAPYAMGAIYTTLAYQPNSKPEDVLLAGLKAASKFDINSNSNYIVRKIDMNN